MLSLQTQGFFRPEQSGVNMGHPSKGMVGLRFCFVTTIRVSWTSLLIKEERSFSEGKSYSLKSRKSVVAVGLAPPIER
jgi:hypothetical protein